MSYKRTYNSTSVFENLQQRISPKYIYCICLCVFCLIFVIWKLSNVINYVDWKFKEIKERSRREEFHANEKVRKVKFVLLWTPDDYTPFYYSDGDQKVFVDKNCSSVNCVVTADRNLFKGDITKFDAIIFTGYQTLEFNIDLPKSRTARQKYIFFYMESAENFPICSNKFNDFFNWTATYRLDSDIPFPYIQIRNQRDEVIGPKQNMEWPKDISSENEFDYRQNKTYAVAWFVSNCNSTSNRMTVATELRQELDAYGQTIDIFGECGSLKCPRFNNSYVCKNMLQKDYFFYLSFENSFCEDYVTEKLLTALNNNVVPIVLGGADYSRFLPPGSYLDARNMTARSLAATINEAMKSPSLYNKFFRWKSLYKYRDPSTTDSVCALCAALNNETLFTTPSYYPDFRSWWHPGYKERCSNNIQSNNRI